MIYFSERLEPHKILQLLSRSIPAYCACWQGDTDDKGLFGSTDPINYNMSAVGRSSPVIEYVIAPHLQIILCLAAFIYHKQESLIAHWISPELCAERICMGLRWACATHCTGDTDVAAFLRRQRWGENWRSSTWAVLAALSATLARRIVPDDLYQRIREICAFEANRFIDTFPPTGWENDTKTEENAQDTMVIAWALAMHQSHPNSKKWKSALKRWGVNTATTIFDKGDNSEYNGVSIARSVCTQTLHPDMTAENHGFFHPEILSCGSWIVLAMAAFALHGKEPPRFIKEKTFHALFTTVLRFLLPNGLWYAPGSSDLPRFYPRPFSLAWGLWHKDPRAFGITARILTWMDTALQATPQKPFSWVRGFEPCYEGWELHFQSLAGSELALLAAVPFDRDAQLISPGSVEKAVDTRHIYPYIQVCYRRNARTTRSVAWKTLDGHPLIGISLHPCCELVDQHPASLLGVPSTEKRITSWEVAWHEDRYTRDGFDTAGRLYYYADKSTPLLSRDIRVITWGEDGLFIFDRITACDSAFFREQLLSPIFLVNDSWTGGQISITSGSLHEIINAATTPARLVRCPSFWVCAENHLLVQLIWKRAKGLVYQPSSNRSAPAFWKNCRVDRIAVSVEENNVKKGDIVYENGLFIGDGKTPRTMKCMGSAGPMFKGLVIMDGKNTIGLD